MTWEASPDRDDLWFCRMPDGLALFVWHCPTYQSGEPIEGPHWHYGVAYGFDEEAHRHYRTGEVPTFNIAKLCALDSYRAGPDPVHDRFVVAMEDLAEHIRQSDL